MSTLRQWLTYLSVVMLMLVGTAQSYAQTSVLKEFTHDRYKFLEEVNTMLMNNASADRRKQGKALMEVFEPIWLSAQFSEEERQAIYQTCDRMLKKRMRPYPDFRSYLFSLVSFVSTDQPEDSFEAWQLTVDNLVEGRSRKKFVDFLTFCDGLFADNILFSSNSTTWKADNSNYQFDIVGDDPILIFPNLKLICLSRRDSSVIHNTGGIYFPTQTKWEGRNGRVTWERAGFDKQGVYAELRSYTINTKGAAFTADSVTFHSNLYFDKPLIGQLTEKVLANVTPEKASYPRFVSYNDRLRINDLFLHVDYVGGYAQYGARFLGKGSADTKAYIIFRRKDKEFIRVSSNAFSIRQGQVRSEDGSLVMYLEEDSIMHPSLAFKYTDDNRTMNVVRGAEGLSQSPFLNTYHQVDMYFESLTWNIDSTQVRMHPITKSSDRSATFESFNYFSEFRFDKLMGLSRLHPLVEIRDCMESRGYGRELTSGDIARCMRASTSAVKPFLFKLANMGFLTYNFDKDEVIIRDRMLDYIQYKSQKKDYDVINIRSEAEGRNNATLSLLDDNFDLDIAGVKTVTLSDSHNVKIFPAGRAITMKKNRDFTFSGIVNAGKFEFFGKGYAFSYDEFKINMPNVDSLRISVDTDRKNAYGNPIRLKVRTVIEYLNGDLFLDEPGNKSGLKDRPRFPVFNSFKDSYAFYERGEIEGGAYKRNDFHFKLDPFEFDSLDNFPNDRIKFNGSFTSAGIFPDFEEVLSLQPDYSLGFVRPTPPGGFEAYGGKGKFFKDIKLSHEGLRGDGKLEYLTSTSTSDNYLFLPQEVNGVAQTFNLDEVFGDPQFPPATGVEVFEHWEPYNDLFRIETIDNPLSMYDGSTMEGTVLLEPKGLTGGGLFSFEQAEMESDLFRFAFNEFFADTSDFRLKTEEVGVDELQFSTVNVNAHIDFTERKGVFESNGGGSFVDFPQNQYIAYMDRFTWYMDELAIELSAGKSGSQGGANELQFEGSRFISTHPDQDSLDFYSSAARYDLRTHIIEARNVEFISVADAQIYPDGGNVTVLKKAKMETLENARVLANNITKFHNIYEADIDIYAKRDYTGSGKYTYVDEKGQEQILKFTSIRVDSIKQTIAKGEITEEDGFTLSPDFAYRGEVILHAAKKPLEFKGSARISHNCEKLDRPWVAFNSEVDPEEVYIPIPESPATDKKRDLAVGVVLNKDSVGIYSTFLSPMLRPNDIKVATADGFLFYDKTASEYKISNINKLNEFSLAGDYVSLNTETCKTYGEGQLDFGTDLGRMKVTPVGNILHDTRDNTVAMDLMILLDFFFENGALDKMAKVMSERTDLEGVAFDRPVFEKGIYELLSDSKEAEKAVSEVTLYQAFRKFPEDLNKALFLTDVKMRWDYNTNSYKSIGGEIGVGSIRKKQVHKMVTGKLELVKKRGRDAFKLYLELDSKTWYYFQYGSNLMQAISSDEDFNKAISDLKPDKRKMKNEKGQAPYSFMLSTKRKKSDFLKKF